MEFQNPKYKKQYLHADVVIFTVENKQVKILLIQRGRAPYIGRWTLPGGAIYNNESAEAAAKRELKYKTGLKNIYLEQFHTFSNPKRDFRARLVAVAYLALVDKNKVSLLEKTPKTLGAKWFEINKLPPLAWDHQEMIEMAIAKLRRRLMDSNIICELLPRQFTLPELHSAYEIILGKKLDRRNFRRKFLNLGLMEVTGKKERGSRYRPAIYYHFKSEKPQEIGIF